VEPERFRRARLRGAGIISGLFNAQRSKWHFLIQVREIKKPGNTVADICCAHRQTASKRFGKVNRRRAYVSTETRMSFQRLLLPTDGSPLATRAGIAGIHFARDLGARPIAIFVAPQYRFSNQFPLSMEMIPTSFPTEAQYIDLLRAAAELAFEPLRIACKSANIDLQTVLVYSDTIARQIVETAHANSCDLIFMGAHGKTGLQQLLLGSVTTKVLAMSCVPILVYRETGRELGPIDQALAAVLSG
jgi:nucleotide-binding universal stress UspA family protein